MKPHELIARLNETLQKALGQWNGLAPTLERDLYERVLALAGAFETKGDAFRPNTQNLRLLRKVRRELETLMASGEYPKAVDGIVSGFSTSAQVMGGYFSSFVRNFDSTQAVLGLVRETSIAATRNSLQGAGLGVALLDPIEKILRDNIVVGGKLADFRAQLRQFMLGSPDVPARLHAYVGQITTDALNQFGRAYMDTVAQEVGLEYYLYEGAIKQNTRAFCLPRAGKFFHRREVEAWAALSWQGKIPGTGPQTIFVYCGGYHCYHFLIPVAIEAVPRAVVDRAIAEGYHKVGN